MAGDGDYPDQTAEEGLLSTIDQIPDDKLTRFALRLALTGHTGIPRQGEIDFLAEAATAFAPPQPAKTPSNNKAKKPTPIKAASKVSLNKKAAKKKAAA